MAKTRKTSLKVAQKQAPKKKPVQNSSDMKTAEIRDLIDFIAQSGLNEVDIETKELKLHVKREPDQKVMKSAAPQMMAPPVAVAAAPPAPVAAPASTPTPAAPASAAPSGGSNLVEIKSPMIGTFYRSSNPDTPPLVSVGDKITKGQTVCIIEAMKLFNEIESEVSGTIVKVLAENATPVEYEQTLFMVEPD
jgi:acetyl-CoA carboxylase biotin carboxyl carrier protein